MSNYMRRKTVTCFIYLFNNVMEAKVGYPAFIGTQKLLPSFLVQKIFYSFNAQVRNKGSVSYAFSCEFVYHFA